jgi:hypothetical protein
VIDLVELIVQRLRDAKAETGLRDVQGAAELSELIDRNLLPQQMPHAFVLPIGADPAAARAATGPHTQAVTETVGVLLLDRVAGDATGARVLPRLTGLRNSIVQLLAGWTPPGCKRPLAWTRGRLVGLSAGTAFYQADFDTDWTLRKG